jgi:hypothetical protein
MNLELIFQTTKHKTKALPFQFIEQQQQRQQSNKLDAKHNME